MILILCFVEETNDDDEVPRKRRKTEEEMQVVAKSDVKEDEKEASKLPSTSQAASAPSADVSMPSTSQASVSSKEVRKTGSKQKRSSRAEMSLLEQVLQNIDNVTTRKPCNK